MSGCFRVFYCCGTKGICGWFPAASNGEDKGENDDQEEFGSNPIWYENSYLYYGHFFRFGEVLMNDKTSLGVIHQIG
jgi:hypothetical protein